MNNVICPLSMASSDLKICTAACAFYANGKCLLAEKLKNDLKKD